MWRGNKRKKKKEGEGILLKIQVGFAVLEMTTPNSHQQVKAQVLKCTTIPQDVRAAFKSGNDQKNKRGKREEMYTIRK